MKEAERATSIQETVHSDSIVARSLPVADFFNTIDPSRTLGLISI
jgi:hypothetical protein